KTVNVTCELPGIVSRDARPPGRHACQANSVLDDPKQLRVPPVLHVGRAQIQGRRSHVAPEISVSARVRTVALGARPKKHLVALAHDLVRLRQRVVHLSRLQWNGDVLSRVGQTGFALGRRFAGCATLKQGAQHCTDHAKHQLVFLRCAAITSAQDANPRQTCRFLLKFRHGVFPFTKKFSRPDRACVTPWKLLLPLELECGGYLLSPAPVTQLTRRDVVYFYSGAHILERLAVFARGLIGGRLRVSAMAARPFCMDSRRFRPVRDPSISSSTFIKNSGRSISS